MILDTSNLLVWKDANTYGIDVRAMRYLRQWLTEDEVFRLVASMSPRRILWLDSFIRDAL